ncbi:MAG: sensor histidine kinase [Mycobacteriales bacterium]
MTPATEQDVWERYRSGWHIFFGVLAVLALTGIAFDSTGPSTSRRLVAGACVLALAAWYAGFGARHLGAQNRHRAMLAATVTVVLVLAGFAAHPAMALLLFIVYPQMFTYLDDLRLAIFAAAVLSLGIGVINAAQSHWSTAGSAAALGGGLVSLVFAGVFGAWISGIIRQSKNRRQLIEELRSAREELAIAHHAAGAAAERQRLALEIHDTLAQGFTSIVMLGQAAAAQVGRSDDELRRSLDSIERTARENLDEARSLVTELGPTSLQSAPLVEALTRLTDNFGAETGVSCSLSVTGESRPLPRGTEVVLLRVAQEALNNVRKHAQASEVTVSLSFVDESVSVRVRDDGRGFVPATAEGFGLQGIRARVEQAGGDVLLESAPGQGTLVGVTLP